MLAGQKSVELRSREYACAGKGWPIVTCRCSIAPRLASEPLLSERERDQLGYWMSLATKAG